MSTCGEQVNPRPVLTLNAAAVACGVSRSTMRRRRESGAFPAAYTDTDGVWQVPVGDLLAAGFTLARPVTGLPLDQPTATVSMVTEHPPEQPGPPAEHPSGTAGGDQGTAQEEIRALREALVAERAALAAERVRRVAIEEIAAERERALVRADLALRVLTATPTPTPIAPAAVVDLRQGPAPHPVVFGGAPAAVPEHPGREGLWTRVGRWFTQ